MSVWEVILGILLILVILYTLPTKEYFNISLPSAVGGYELLDLEIFKHLRLFSGEVYSLTPYTCPPDRSDLDAGLCYVPCRDGFRGVGPVCWAKTQGIGIGTPVGLEPCPDGWSNDGLTCREPISCRSIGDCFAGRGCGCQGGRIKGRLDNGGICPGPGGDDFKDKVDGLCYKECPTEYPVHLPGMPYLCYKGGELSYGRGVGKIPSFLRIAKKYTFF